MTDLDGDLADRQRSPTPMAQATLLAKLLLTAGLTWAADPIELATPKGGWRAGAGSTEFVQEVHYPASRVNLRDNASSETSIRGRIVRDLKANAPAKRHQPATLIVNGTPMPLELDDDGRFGRPYAFASGSNSVEIRSPDGSRRKRVQFVDAAGGARPRLRVLLSWDSRGTDLDLHVITPAGQHCYYGNRVIEGGGALDVDVTTGYGPEIFATARPDRGIWHVYVNYYGGGDAASEGGPTFTIAQIVVIDGEGLPNETRRSYRVPLRASGDLQHVASFSVL